MVHEVLPIARMEELSDIKREVLDVKGNILYLTKDFSQVRSQILGIPLEAAVNRDDLMDGVSTDEIIPNAVCLSYSGEEAGYLGRNLLTGLPGDVIKPGDLKGKFQVLVAGSSFAKGSSRIHAPLAFREAGINIIIAESERIFAENSANCGIYIIDPESEAAKEILDRKSPSMSEVMSGMSSITQEIMKSGGLLPFFRRFENGHVNLPVVENKKRPMTITEKIIAKKLESQNQDKIAYVKPGEEYILEPDQYYGYEIQSSAVISALKDEFGERIVARRPEKITLHNDHTALLNDAKSRNLRKNQAAFGRSLSITVYEADEKKGAPAICHTKMMEDHVLPGQLVLGNDSHTDTLGVLNCLAVGKGAVDLAGAIAYDRMTLKVPESIRVNLSGKLKPGVTIKDFMLQFGSMEELRDEKIGSGRIFEFGGEALEDISIDEQLKLTNMSIELLGFGGIIEPNARIIDYLKRKRGLSDEEITSRVVENDKDAEYYHVFDFDLSTVEPTVAEPGNPQNGRPLSEIKEQNIKINKVYLGSCTHGTVEDLKHAADVLRGRKISKDVRLYVQASSLANQKEAEEKGYLKDIINAGGERLPIGCGACMNAGPGSTEKGEIGLFATNRNLPNRTGKGETYLSSVPVAVASAVMGYICGPEDLPSID